MDRFSKTHPAFQFLFFGFVFVLSLACYNPFFSVISFAGALCYGLILRGRKALSSLKFMLTIIAFVGIFNMLFAHYGEDVLFKLENTEFTIEALFYGFNQGVVIASVIMWFSSFSRVVDSEKVIYVLRSLPKTALIFSMVLSFLPRFTKKLEDIRTAKLGLGGGEAPKGFKAKLKNGVDNFSTLVSYSLESSVVTANSMSARGYNPKAIRQSRYRLNAYDIALIIASAGAFSYVMFSIVTKRSLFIFEPEIYVEGFDLTAVIMFAILCFLPVIIDFMEELLWKLSSVKN